MAAPGSEAQITAVDADDPNARLQRPAAPRYDVIALRVEFQPDSSRFSTGNGTFNDNLFLGLQPEIDPFPHDGPFFEAKLEFLSTYVERVSRGATVVETHLLPDVIRVSGKMADYSPIGPDADSDPERSKLARLVEEAWTTADSQVDFSAADFDPAATAFVLFHAGTGRDIELTGTTLDRTPEDLPSLYFDTASLDRLLGGPVMFKGLTVASTAVIPETESKRAVDPITEDPFLLELSTNGLIAASFFNHLGVPDLFDTATGQSAIGPYGLMDPLGIFAYGGLLPPEPSGWTKQYLGWTTPQRLSDGAESITLRAGVDAAIAPVSSTEYFLAEARHRDPAGDALNLVALVDGQRVELRFEHDAEDFSPFNQSGFRGVLISADDYDWALPGGFDTSGELRLGGILIWHVDENRIRAGLDDNSVNADRLSRGVDLEEADSAQDLGYPNDNPFAPDFDRGTPFDFFFEGNPVTAITETGEVVLYENRFADDTWPNSRSNAAGPSFVVLENFSPVSTTMTFDYHRDASELVRPLESLSGVRLGSEIGYGASVTLVYIERGPGVFPNLIVHSPEKTTGWIVDVGTGDVLEIPGMLTKPASIRREGGPVWTGFLQTDDTEEISLAVITPGLGPLPISHPLLPEIRFLEPSTPLVVIDEGGDEGPVFYAGYELDGAGALLRIDWQGEATLTHTAQPAKWLAVVDETSLAVVQEDRTQILTGSEVVFEWTYAPLDYPVDGSFFVRDISGISGFILIPFNTLYLAASGDVVQDLPYYPSILSHDAVGADLDLDGLTDVVSPRFEQRSAFDGYNTAGAVISGFPVDIGSTQVGQPLIAYWEDERRPSILYATEEGYIHAYSTDDRRERPGFPLGAGGAGGQATPLLADSMLIAVSGDGSVTGWIVDGLSSIGWGQLYGDRANSSFAVVAEHDSPSGPTSGDLIDPEETYNWPNPIRNGETRIRIRTTRRSDVSMTVVDMSGALVYEARLGQAAAGIATEFDWTSIDLPSGVYYALVTANPDDGTSETALITIGVVR